MSTRLIATLLSALLLAACSNNNASNDAQNKKKSNDTPQPKKVVLFDASTTGKDYHIWATDGSEEGTQPLLEQFTMKATPSKDWMIEFDEKVVFLARPLVKGQDNDDHGHDHHHHHKNARSVTPTKKPDEPAKLFVTDGTKQGTKELKGTGENAFERVASPFYKIDNSLYFAGYDKTDHYSIYKTDTETVEKVSKNFYQAIGLDINSSFDITAFNNTLFLFTKLPQNNKIYVFNKKAKSSENRWREIISTDNYSVEANIRSATINDFVFIFTKPKMGVIRQVYQINTKTFEAKLADSQFLPLGITRCHNNKVCGFQVSQGNLQLRTLTPNSVAKTFDITLNSEKITPNKMNFTNPIHVIDNDIYILLKKPTPSLHKINEDGTLSKAITVKGESFTLKEFAKRDQDKRLITQHPTVNGLTWVYAQSNQNTCTVNKGSSQGNYEPWVIDTKTKTASPLKDIRNEKNETHLTAGSCISSFTQQTRPVLINEKIVFIANGGDSGENPTGNEMWITDGTEAGTKILKDIAPKAANGVLVESGHHHHVHPI